jgi:hypothetical protein
MHILPPVGAFGEGADELLSLLINARMTQVTAKTREIVDAGNGI